MNKSINNTSILVTGGCGFIGSNIVEELLKRGVKRVRVLDNLITGKMENIKFLLDKYENLEFMYGDISKLEDCRKAVINMDDPKGRILEKITNASVVSYGLGDNCLFRATDIESTAGGLHFRLVTPVGGVSIASSLLGQVNVYNIMGAAATAYSLNIDLKIISRGIFRVPSVLVNVARRHCTIPLLEYFATRKNIIACSVKRESVMTTPLFTTMTV